MNNNIQNGNNARRRTRSHQVSIEDKNLYDMNYIDNYYSKKKKNFYNSILNNDTLSTTKIKFPMPNLLNYSSSDQIITEEAIQKEKSSNEVTNENMGIEMQHPPDNIINKSINFQNEIDNSGLETKFEYEEKNEELDKSDKNLPTQAEYAEINEEMKMKEKNCVKLFSVEQIPNEEKNITNPPKKRSKRYLELLENSLLIFDREEKKLLSNKKPRKKKNAENLQNLEKNVQENEYLEKEKNEKIVEEVKQIITLEKDLAQTTNIYQSFAKNKNISSEQKDLLIIYDELRDIRMLGKKRNLHSLLIKPKTVTNIYNDFLEPIELPKINFENYKNICKIKDQHGERNNIGGILKKNFINSQIENYLNEKISLLKKSEKKIKNDDSIPNPFDETLRREFANQLGFIQTFQEDYAPIKMQKDNEKMFEKFENSETLSITSSSTTNNLNSNISSAKSHFIKKKQSAVNIKRQCGVSYVVPSESKQKNVNDTYKSLGHLVYQGTYSVNLIQDENIINYINNLIIKELMNKPLIVTTFESPDECEMKEYLLFPEKRLSIAKEVFIIESLDEIWKFSKDKFFFAVNLMYDETRGVRNFTEEEIVNNSCLELLCKSDIQIGILFRKATSGIKSVLKLYKNAGLDKIEHPSTYKLCNLNPEENIHNLMERVSGTNMTTLSMRIELFVPEDNWKKSNLFCKELLYTFMSQVEEKISKLLLNWNEYRNLMYSLNKDNKVREYIHNFPYYTLNNINSKESIQIISKSFTLEKSLFENKNLTENLTTEVKFDLSKCEYLNKDTIKVHNSYADKLSLINNLCFQNQPLPMYIISTRDCFVFDLNVKVEEITYDGRKYIRKEYFFDENNIPSNYHKFRSFPNDLRVGVITYENYFNHEELCEIERKIEQTEEYSLKDAFLPETAQKTFAGEKLKRTKFFFGSRYMWTKKQLAEPNSYVGAGIRKDVSPPPFWIKEKIEDPLVKAGIMLGGFINSYALNVYHDGSEGLGQHFDDAVRFKQPIYTLRLFSDCRLSFGSQLYGFCNGAFTIPLPRGCICVMEGIQFIYDLENSYASNGVKHCIRPCDMTGKSSALILRQMHPIMINEAEKYDLYVDFPSWFSSLSINENAVTYNSQKSAEAEFLIKISEYEKKSRKFNDSKFDDQILDTINDILDSVEMYNLNNNKKFLTPTPKKKGRKNEY